MSYAMVVYSVPLDRLRAAFGSRDRSLLSAIDADIGRWLDKIDGLFDDPDPDEPPLPVREAIGHILDGGPFREGRDAVYVFAYEAVCGHLGRELDNGAFQPPIRWEWMETVGRHLKSAGFPLDVRGLAYDGCPLPIPHDSDHPSVGWWSAEALEAGRAAADKLRASGEDLAGAMATVRGWLADTADRPGDILVGVYS